MDRPPNVRRGRQQHVRVGRCRTRTRQRRRRHHDGGSRWYREVVRLLCQWCAEGERSSNCCRPRGVQAVDQGVHQVAASVDRKRHRGTRQDRAFGVHADPRLQPRGVRRRRARCHRQTAAGHSHLVEEGSQRGNRRGNGGNGRRTRRHRRCTRPVRRTGEADQGSRALTHQAPRASARGQRERAHRRSRTTRSSPSVVGSGLAVHRTWHRIVPAR